MKKSYSLLLGIIASCIFSNASFGQLTFWNDLYLYYPFGGNAQDQSGYDNHGQALNVTAATGVWGDPDGSYRFNGTNSMVVRNALTLGDSVTMAAWFYSESDSNSCGLIYNGNTGFNGYGIFVKKPFGSIANGSYMGKTLVLVQGGVDEAYFNNSFDLPTNQWYHIAIVRKGNILEIYLNGDLQTTAPYMANSPQGEFSVGSSAAHTNTGYGSFTGKIDEVMVFRSALNAQNVQRVYTNNITDAKPLVNTMTGIKILGQSKIGDYLSIISEKYEITSVELFDMTGKLCETNSIDNGGNKKSISLDVSNMKAGIYTARILTAGNSTSAKVVLNK